MRAPRWRTCNGWPPPRPDNVFYGVDGCPGGWIAIGLDAHGASTSHLAPTFASLVDALAQPQLVLVDMPIGLPSAAVPDRVCDRAARALLGRGRASSVFPVPARAALAVKDYEMACDINARELGKRLSKQTWYIAGKIRELDEYLAAARAPCPIREMHPEVAFAALNGGVAIAAGKKQPEGRGARLELLSRQVGGAAGIVAAARNRFTRQQLCDDDILDALVGAVLARHEDALETLPESPIRDERGLPMEIVLPPGGSGYRPEVN